MSPIKKTDLGMRCVFCGVLLLLALLLLGAGRFREDMTNRRARAQQTRTACREAVANLKQGIAEENRQAWSELAGKNPELFVRISSAGMREL